MKHLFLLFGFLLAAFTAQAATITQEGVTPDDGAGLYYNLYDDGTAEIVRNPDNSVYSMESLAIPATVTYNGVTYRVTTIGNNAFFNSTIKSISGGGNITKIGLCAFYVCKSLTSIGNILDNVTEIPSEVFDGCTSLTGNITITAPITSIGNNVFHNCSDDNLSVSFTNLTDAVIGDRAFIYFKRLKSLAGTVKSIGKNAFLYCSNFTLSIYNPSTLPTINNDSFESCSDYTILVHPDILAAYQAAEGWKDLSLQSLLKNEYYNVAPDDGNGLIYHLNTVGDRGTAQVAGIGTCGNNVVIPAKITYEGKTCDVTGISDAAFSRTSITSVSGGENITSIGQSAFYKCTNLTSIGNLLDNITDIPSSAFYYCSALTGTITLNAAITNIGESAFNSCNDEGLSLSISNLTNATIGYRAFRNCKGLKSIGGTAASIGEYAFYECSNLTSIGHLLDNVTDIPNNAFYNCSALTGNITLTAAITNIGESAFYNCSKEGLSLNISNLTDAAIGSSAFFSCVSLKSIAGTAKSIGKMAFINCSNLASIGHLLDNVTDIPISAFDGCSSLTGEITLNAAITNIGDYAFFACSNEGLSLSISNLTNATIGKWAFRNCTGLKSIEGTAASIGEDAFYGCTNLTSIGHLLDNVTTIPGYAFYSCSALPGNITLNAGINNIGEYAFTYSGISNIYCLAATPPTLGNRALGYFYGAVKVPSSAVRAYKSSWGTSYSNLTISAGDPTSATTAANSGSTTHWATFSNTYSDSELSVEAGKTLTLYNATVADGKLTLTERTGSSVAKGEAVLIKTDAEIVSVTPFETTDLVKAEDNDLLATPEYTTILHSQDGCKYYRLTYNNATDKTGLGFYLGVATVDEVTHTDGTYLNASPYKAYLKVTVEDATEPSAAAPARGFAFPGDDDITGIECITVTDEELHKNGNAKGIYDLQGRKVSKPSKGVYIKNNKLFLN